MKRIALVACCVVIVGGCRESQTPSTGTSILSNASAVAEPDGPKPEPKPPRENGPDAIDLTVPYAAVVNRVKPTVIDTRTFSPQITRPEVQPDGAGAGSDSESPKPPLPVLANGPANELVAGKQRDVDRVVPGALFPAIGETVRNPPDPSIAVGPSHIVQMVNADIAFFQKDGTQTFQQRLGSDGDPGFFEDVGSGSLCFDPRCFYDHHANRFVVLVLERYDFQGESWITLAISDDNDPHGIWYKYRTYSSIAVDNSLYWVDFPSWGYDQNGYYVTGNLFRLSGYDPPTAGVVYRVLDKLPLLDGEIATFADLRDPEAFTWQAAQHFGDNFSPYFVTLENESQLRVSTLTGPLNDPSLETSLVDIPAAPYPPYNVPNAGGTQVTTTYFRMMNAHWRDGSLWCAHAIGIEQRAAARWYEIATGDWPMSGSPTLVQSGEVDLGEGRHTFMPAIYSNVDGDAAMVMARSHSDEFVSVQAVGRTVADPPGTMSNPVQLAIGTAGASGRWGDYYDIAIDPVDDRTFWMSGEIQRDSGWETMINSFTVVDAFVPVNDFVVIAGDLVSGGLEETAHSDDQRMLLQPEPLHQQGETSVSVILIGAVSGDGLIELLVESQTDCANFEYTAEMWNWNAQQYDVVGTQPASAGMDAVDRFQIDNAAHIGSTNEVRARLTWRPTGLVLAYPWQVRLDQTGWSQ